MNSPAALRRTLFSRECTYLLTKKTLQKEKQSGSIPTQFQSSFVRRTCAVDTQKNRVMKEPMLEGRGGRPLGHFEPAVLSGAMWFLVNNLQEAPEQPFPPSPPSPPFPLTHTHTHTHARTHARTPTHTRTHAHTTQHLSLIHI